MKLNSANLETQKVFLNLVDTGYLTVTRMGVVTNTKTGKIYTRTNIKGYVPIAYKYKGKKIQILAHRLVWLVYRNRNLSPDIEINHRTGVKNNNRVWRLEEATTSENCQHAHDIGLVKITWRMRKQRSLRSIGELGSSSKLSNKEAGKIRRMYDSGNYSQRELGRMFNMSHTSIGDITRQQSYRDTE